MRAVPMTTAELDRSHVHILPNARRAAIEEDDRRRAIRNRLKASTTDGNAVFFTAAEALSLRAMLEDADTIHALRTGQ